MTSTGECLYAHALVGGARGTMQPVGWFEGTDASAPGTRADFLVLDDDAPEMIGAQPGDAVDRWIFSGNRNLVREVYVAGHRVVAEGRHLQREAIATRYRRTLESLLAD